MLGRLGAWRSTTRTRGRGCPVWAVRGQAGDGCLELWDAGALERGAPGCADGAGEGVFFEMVALA